MTYEEAMDAIRGTTKVSVGRAAAPGREIGTRFGEPRMVAGTPNQIPYTPTEEDMKADDWVIVKDTR